MQNAFPTLGAAVLYLNGFHHGKLLDRLNFLARHEPEWVMSIANTMWIQSCHEDIAENKPLLLAFAVKEAYVQTFNEQIDA
jgi:hypothetical protein